METLIIAQALRPVQQDTDYEAFDVLTGKSIQSAEFHLTLYLQEHKMIYSPENQHFLKNCDNQ